MTPSLTIAMHRLLCRKDGSAITETALALPFMILLLVGAVDFGRAFYTAIEVESAAEAGALYGQQNLTNLAGIQAAAQLDAPDVTGLTAVATYGCECADGTSASVSCAASPTCSTNVVNYVQVVASVTYQPILKYPGMSSIPLSTTVKMRAGQ
jgi:Flp pilus assembly protein TadG